MGIIEIPDGFQYIVLSQRGFDSETPLVDVLDSFQVEAELLNKETPVAAKRFLDIGSGIGFSSLMLYKLRRQYDPNFYLFDKSAITENIENVEFRKQHHFFYNDFSCTSKIISQSELPVEPFHFIDAELENLLKLPTMDVVFSFFSWGWHYHVDTYISALLDIVESGTIVIADVRVDAVADYDDQKNLLSNAFGAEPEILKTYYGWKKSKITDTSLSKIIENNSPDYGETKGNHGGPKGHRFKWIVA